MAKRLMSCTRKSGGLLSRSLPAEKEMMSASAVALLLFLASSSSWSPLDCECSRESSAIRSAKPSRSAASNISDSEKSKPSCWRSALCTPTTITEDRPISDSDPDRIDSSATSRCSARVRRSTERACSLVSTLAATSSGLFPLLPPSLPSLP